MKDKRALALTACVLPLLFGGCSEWMFEEFAEIAYRENRRHKASFTVRSNRTNPHSVQSTLRSRYGVSNVIQMIEAGVWTIRMVGAAAQIADATRYLMRRGMTVTANDRVAEGILEIAITALQERSR